MDRPAVLKIAALTNFLAPVSTLNGILSSIAANEASAISNFKLLKAFTAYSEKKEFIV